MTDKPIWSPVPQATWADAWCPGSSTPDAGPAVGRSLEKLAARPWAFHPNVELVQADLADLASTRAALAGCETAYYLVHSMHPHKRDFAAADRHAALIMARAAREEGLSRIIYLGGLGEDREDLSHHLKSRPAVALILSPGGTPLPPLRAARILGAGRASFELMRYWSTAAGHGHPLLGAHPLPAHRHHQRPWLPDRVPGRARDRGPDLRHRRPGRAQLRGPVPGLRRGGGPAPAADHPRAGHVPQALRLLGPDGHPGPGLPGHPPGGRPAQRGGVPGKRHPGDHPPKPCAPAGNQRQGHGKNPAEHRGDQFAPTAAAATPPEWLAWAMRPTPGARSSNAATGPGPRPNPGNCGTPWPASAARPAGTTGTPCGGCGAFWTNFSAG